MTTPAWISLGSNLGDRRAILDEALARLGQIPGVAVAAVSSYHETLPVGGPVGQGRFLNAAARLKTTLSPLELLVAMQAIEADLGRVRTVRWGERTLDLDLLMYASKFLDEPDLKLPHPRLAVRRFVLEPLAEIAPDITDTITQRRIAELLKNLNRQPRSVMFDNSINIKEPRMFERLAASLFGTAVAFKSFGTDNPSRALWHDHWTRLRERLAMIDTYQTALTLGQVREDRWLVFDFALDVTSERESCSASWIFELDEAAIARAAFETPKMWYSTQIGRKLVDLPDSTLIVALGHSKRPRKAGISRTPIYWPEATESDAIVAEVAAVCQGIAGV